MRNRIEEAEYRDIASELGLAPSDVKRAVSSFFDVFIGESRSLPFDDCQRIYSREKFNSLVKVRNIPCIGRFGPHYSRYIKWRSNEAGGLDMIPRKKSRRRIPQEEIEKMASDILSGITPLPLSKVKFDADEFARVWMVHNKGRKLARQVIVKKSNKDVQD